MDYLFATVAKIGAKTCVKIGLNTLLPGLGSVCDFGEALVDVYNGDYVSAALNAGSGTLDLVTLGTFSVAKDVSKRAGKEAMVSTAKSSAKSATKKVGQEAARQIAIGGDKSIVIEVAKQSSDAVKKEIGRNLGRELGRNVVEDITEGAFKKSLSEASKQGVIKGLVGSGGKDILKNVFEETTADVMSNVLTRTVRHVPINSTTLSAAKGAIDSIAKEHMKTAYKRELALNGVKGVTRALDFK